MADDNQQNTSTLQSYIDSAKAAVENLTGSSSSNQDTTTHSSSHDASKPGGNVSKLGPVAVSSDGGVARDDPDRAQGRWEQTLGSAKEAVGGLIGSESLKQQGKEQRLAGEEKEARGQISDLGQGMADRVEGGLKSTFAGITGDREERDKWDAVHDKGKAQVGSVARELDKQQPQQDPHEKPKE